MADNHVVLLGCGDVGPIHEPLDVYGKLAHATLEAGDIRFAQVERVYSDRGELGSQNDHGLLKPHMAAIFNHCGFDVVSVASNHSLDFGEEALLDSIAILRKNGIQTVGAGRNLQEACQPTFIKRNGVNVAFLAYCSVLREGHAAGPNKPGVAPMRAHVRCEPLEYQAGVPPMVITTPYEEDLQVLVDTIAAAKKAADIVVLSLHWGIHYIPRMLADYQFTVAKVAFDAGADLIFGHHAHAPKAIETFGDKVCFYSLGNFILTTLAKSAEKMAIFSRRYGAPVDPEYPNLPQGRDAKRSLIAKAVLTRDGVKNVSFLPVLIDRQLRPEVLYQNDPRFDEAVKFMEWVSDGRRHKFSVVGDEVVVT